MGIKSIVNMKNFGRFNDTKSIEFGRNTVIFGFNGMGKSTLSSIFYSLANGEKDSLIFNRAQLKDKESDPKKEVYIEVETDLGKHYFNNKKWDKRLVNFTFNGEYVQDNVLVSNVTKRAGTYSVEIDRDIIRLNFKKEELNNKIDKDLLIKLNETFSQYNEEIKSIAATGNAKNLKRTSSPNIKKVANIQLIAQHKKDSIDKSISEINKYDNLLRLIESASDLVSELPVKSFIPIDINSIKKILEMNPSITPEELNNHMNKFFKKNNTHWLLQGLFLSKDLTNCPYCGQDVITDEAKKFIKAIRTFVQRKKIKRLNIIKEKVIDLLRIVDSEAFNNAFIKYKEIIKIMEDNKLFTKKKFDYFFRIIDEPLTEGLDSLIHKLKLKHEQPFETIIIDDDEIKSLKSLNLLLNRLAGLKDYLKKLENNLIDKRTKDKSLIKNQNLYKLSFSESREEIEQMIKYANEILNLEIKIKEIEKIQIDMREKIHLEKISNVLKELNAKFSIVKDDGKFFIKLEDFEEKVEYNKNADERSNYLLSEGDQRALAFAYFLFELNQQTNLSERIIIFDDPISSLDVNRKSIIAYKISELMKDKTNQIIVLSHDISFVEKLQHFYRQAQYYMLNNNDDVVSDLKIDDFILSDADIYSRFIDDACQDNCYSNIVIALMSLRPLYEITKKETLCSKYNKFSTYFNHSIYAKIEKYQFSLSKYNTNRLRTYFNHVKKKVGLKQEPSEIIPEGFVFNGLDYHESLILYESINGDDINSFRKKALLIRLLLEVLMVKLSNHYSLKCKSIGKDYQRILNNIRKGSLEYKFASKIIEAYNLTKKFHHGAESGSMLGLSWINPDEIEYYDSIIREIVEFTKGTNSVVTGIA